MIHNVFWDGKRWVCSCNEEIVNDAEARRHYNLDMDRRARAAEHLQVAADDK